MTGMVSRRRKWLSVLALLLAVGLPGYYALVKHSPQPGAAFPLDIARIRALADSIPGDKATAVRYEDVLALRFVEAMLMAGDPWRQTPMPVYSYQLVFPGQTIIVDTALAKADGKPEFLGIRYDDAAYQRMNAAMSRAAQIVITHEHMDHIGGIAAHPQLARLKPALRLTAEQLANPKGMEPVKLPTEPLAGYEPLRYDDLLAIAPGVVLIKAPGHTPGSQMVYVKRADDRELLLLGDISWRRRNIENVRERPLFMTLIIGENRGQVMAQFAALNALSRSDPAIALVPGHDGPAVEALAASGLLERGFQ
jgi:glyoxylase-like metal-dependent hydrolase (beta-lactamase superfamily II)